MADILEYLNTIKNAVYGKDVRQAIVDGISQCYTDGKAGVNDLQARQLIEAVAAVNEEQTAALEVLQAKIEELEESEGGTQQSTTVDIPTVLVDGGVEENVAVNNNSTVIHHVTFTTEFTEIPKVMVAIGKNVGAVSQYGYLSANILYPTITKTGFDFFLANRTGSDRSPGVVWYAYQPTVETIDLDITIPDAQGMTESQVRAITGPISAAVDAIKTGYDGTVYQTAAEAIRTQINALHVLIGDEPGTAISADSIGYEDGSVSDALDGLNERLTELESGSRGGLTDTQKELIITILRNAIYTSDQSKNIDELEDAFANTVISISATLDLRENTIYSDDTLDTLRQYLTVRATYDDGTTQTITGYALSGTLTVGTSTIQVIYRDATASVNVPVSQAVVRYTVTNNLTGVTNSNTDTTIAESNTYTGILTAETTGYIPINVSVTVGGTDVTSTAYDSSTHTITITNVQGNIVIVASEGEDPYAPKFELTSPLIVGDTTDPRINDTANNRIATGVTVNDNENWTVCVDFTSLLDGAVQGASILRNDNNQFTVIYNSPNWNAAWHGSNKVIKNDYSGGKWRGLNFVAIITHESNTLSVNVYGTVTNTITKASIATASNGQVYIGSTYQMGTINRLAIYKRVLTADEITAWIGE